MLSEVFKLLESDHGQDRIKGWNRLRNECAALQLTSDDIERLLRALANESLGEAWHQAVIALFHLGLLPKSLKAQETDDPKPKLIEPAKYLSDWFWEPLKGPSAVLGLSDPEWRRRDEGAILMLGRHLSHDNFPNTQFHPIPIDDPPWDSVLATQHPTALCIVGRLGLFGDAALRQWGRDDLRFSFLVKRRPKKNPPRPGKIHKRFHCICEHIEGQEKPLAYHTTQVKRRRTDYALVQRYTVHTGSDRMQVITTAGSTGVGTLAAAQWAALLLTRPRHLKDRIQVTRDITDESKLEALLRVTTDPNVQRWALTDIELVKLYVDDWEWSTATGWSKLPLKSITIECENGDPKRPVAVVCRSKHHTLNEQGTLVDLVSAIYKQTGGQAGAVIDESALVKMKTWGNNKSLVRRRLSTLRVRHFEEALHIGKEVTLTVPMIVKAANRSANAAAKSDAGRPHARSSVVPAPESGDIPRARRSGKRHESSKRGIA
jgi:hypothetical protein